MIVIKNFAFNSVELSLFVEGQFLISVVQTEQFGETSMNTWRKSLAEEQIEHAGSGPVLLLALFAILLFYEFGHSNSEAKKVFPVGNARELKTPHVWQKVMD